MGKTNGWSGGKGNDFLRRREEEEEGATGNLTPSIRRKGGGERRRMGKGEKESTAALPRQTKKQKEGN